MSSTIREVVRPLHEEGTDRWRASTVEGADAQPRPAVLVVGSGPALSLVADHAAVGGIDTASIAVLARDDSLVPPGTMFAGPVSQLREALDSYPIRRVLLCLAEAERGLHNEVLDLCEERGMEVLVPLPRPAGARPAMGLQRAAKRALDVIGAVVGLIVLSPLLFVAAVAIVLSDGRPVLFRQRRAGQDGRPFTIAKFRTMGRGADTQRDELRAANAVTGGAAFKMDDDPRVTLTGRWLRRTSIDELPQLWNVLRGEMSLVGPRPHPYDDIAGYDAWHLRRLAVKPGITGLWQIELRNDDDFDRWVAKDLEYIDRWSIGLDLAILARTIPAVLRGSGR